MKPSLNNDSIVGLLCLIFFHLDKECPPGYYGENCESKFIQITGVNLQPINCAKISLGFVMF